MTDLVTGSSITTRLLEWAAAAQGAYAPATQRAYQSDFDFFRAWCALSGATPLPASAETVAQFLRSQSEAGLSVATIRRRAATIARLHTAAGLSSPCGTEPVRLALRAIARDRGTQQRQAAPLTAKDAHKIQGALDDARLKDARDVALLLVGKDLLVRASELVALTVGAISFEEDGTAHVALRRHKTSTEPQSCLLGPDAAGSLRKWLQGAGIAYGVVFRSITKGGNVTDAPLSTRDVSRILKALGTRALLDASRISSHSMRVGTAIDCVAANIDTAAIMQAGGWTSVRMVARYTSRLSAKRGAIARLHKLTG